MPRRTVSFFPFLGTLLILCLAGCAGRPYRHESLAAAGFVDRARTQRDGDVTVTAAVPSPEEAERVFGIPLGEQGIQPVWLRVENRSSRRVRYAWVGTDRTYFSPFEVAYTFRSGFSNEGRDQMARRIRDLTMPRQIPPGETRSGFIFTHASPGTKVFNVDLFGADRADHSFTFFLQVPGFAPDYREVGFEDLYRPGEIREVGEDGLRDALAGMPARATDPSGAPVGLPVNLALVGKGKDLLHALLLGGWHETQRPGEVGTHHLFGRPPDAIFRLPRGTRGERNELRVWLAPLMVRDDPVWLGQITQYIGRPTPLGRALFDPRLDPDLDEARNFIIQNLWYAQGLIQYGWLDTGSAVPGTAPAADFHGVEYFTDGYRAVMWVSADPISMLETVRVPWDPAPRRPGDAP